MNYSPETARPVVIVDAYSTGALLARAISESRPCIHVCSRAEIPPLDRPSFVEELFIKCFVYDGENLEALVGELSLLQPFAVVAGSEMGVGFADALAAGLGIVGNCSSTSAQRRNKFEMSSAVGRAGLPTASQIRGSDQERLLDWYRSQASNRIVVKPLDSAGSEDVFVCDDEAQVLSAIQKILGSTNCMFGNNEQVLLQEYLQGPEYVVNSVSVSGRHWITDSWQANKRLIPGGRNIYDFDELVDPHVPAMDRVFAYVEGVLNALGIEHGPGHTELILTESGPRLLETGARVSGAANPFAIRLATGSDQIEFATVACLDPQALEQRPSRYPRIKHSLCVHMIVHREGILDRNAILKQIKKLPSFVSAKFRLGDSQHIGKTVDVDTCPGAFFIVHEDPERLRQDYDTYREWELATM
ncbi:biotin carboxylase [Xanthomonas translucens pv. poae]|uniref:Biotin carboxylase n=1 Tax=Xanthomonas graminis pv. poae TaxID=227946 RepID=A0A0K3ACJ8_9XANT|nr:ATP-grasp domain-containing protein [Xanthomonas translucens]UKE63130.1 ATP-grasp domain-containing protein [Xanthomonas translucens pv. poae]CTP93230.1 biotin carboxylase [Xanthomonas translucens pv. poae]